jgi:hypothetical protein
MENLRYYDLILERESCRAFTEEDVEQADIQHIKDSISLCDALDDSIETELHIIDSAAAEKLGTAVGYNGFMIRAPKYALLFTEEKDHALENAAFIMQALTLKMTSLGLAACWLTINDAEKAEAQLDIDTDKTLAVVVGFGYRNKEKKSTRLDIKSPSDVKVSKNSKRTAPKIALDEFVFENRFGEEAPLDLLSRQYPQLNDALICMSVAQSFFNRQPYRVILTKNSVCLIGLDDEMTGEADRHLNYGIEMFNFYAVNERTRGDGDSLKKWTFDAPEGDLGLPENAHFVAQCRL